MNKRTNACSRSGNGHPTERLQHQGPYKSLEPRCSRDSRNHPEATQSPPAQAFARCLCVSFLPTPPMVPDVHPSGRLNLQTGCLCWRPGYLLPCETVGGCPLLPNPLGCPAKLKIIGYPRLRDSSSCPRRAAQDIPML